MVKKLLHGICLLLFVGFSLFMQNALAGNAKDLEQQNAHLKYDKLYIVATSFHEYDWLRQIIGEEALEKKNGHISLTLLIDNGIDIHSFEPSIQDIRVILNSDLFVYNGGNSDNWVKDVLLLAEQETTRKEKYHFKSFNIMDVLENAQKISEHHEHSHERHHNHANCTDPNHDHSHNDHAYHNHDTCTDPSHNHGDNKHAYHEKTHNNHAQHAHFPDEHIWLSLKNAILICERLSQILEEIDPLNKEMYRQNTKKYIASLKALHEKFLEEKSYFVQDTILMADRFPFVYMMKDYGINYFAAFHGCSAETEASFQTIAFLTKKLNELSLDNIFILENGLKNLAKTIVMNSDNKNCSILELNSMQSISKEDIEKGVTYHTIMEKNLEVLKSALSH